MILTASVSSGALRGIQGKRQGVSAFLGVPYAQAPAGKGRFTAPLPPERLDGVRFCGAMSPAPVQLRHPQDQANVSEENCLTLNIYTGAESASERRPVLFWIYGGAFRSGSNADPEFDGEAFAEKGAVVVVINYRVSALGFFSTRRWEERTGQAVNAGLMDQIAALQWVRENIASFGGDPERVTIFGQSAGGMSVRMLLTSKLARGLFHRAIVQSGGGLNEGDLVRPKEEFQQLCAECLKRLGWTEDDLASRDPVDLTASLERVAHDLLEGRELALFQPFQDGVVLTDVPGRMIARGEYADVPVLCGTVAGDSWMFCRKVLGDMPDPACFRGFALSAGMAWAHQAPQVGKPPIRTYFMDRTQPPRPQPPYKHGAPPYGADTPHGTEIAYLFGTLPVRGLAHQPLDDALADAMRQYWVNFAATGDPNGAGLPAWPPCEADEWLSLRIGDGGIGAENLLHNDAEARVIAYTMAHPGMLTSLEGF